MSKNMKERLNEALNSNTVQTIKRTGLGVVNARWFRTISVIIAAGILMSMLLIINMQFNETVNWIAQNQEILKNLSFDTIEKAVETSLAMPKPAESNMVLLVGIPVAGIFLTGTYNAIKFFERLLKN